MGLIPLIEELWDGYQHLTPSQKRVVFEMYWNGYTEEETAETMGVSRSTVSRTIAAARDYLEKRLARLTQSVGKKQLVRVKEENGEAERGNGLVTKQAHSANKAPASSGPPASFCPPPDIYLGSPARDAFIKELSWIAASPFLQLQGRGGYNERARMNRERLARDRERERAERMAAIAA